MDFAVNGGHGGIGPMHWQYFSQLNADNSGGLNQEEFAAALEKFADRTERPDVSSQSATLFSIIDQNGNDQVSILEIWRQQSAIRHEFGEELGETDEGTDEPLQFPHLSAHIVRHTFRHTDANRSGDINLEEFTAQQHRRAERTGEDAYLQNIEERFDQIDSSGNGEFTLPELAHFFHDRFTELRSELGVAKNPVSGNAQPFASESAAALLREQEQG